MSRAPAKTPACPHGVPASRRCWSCELRRAVRDSLVQADAEATAMLPDLAANANGGR